MAEELKQNDLESINTSQMLSQLKDIQLCIGYDGQEPDNTSNDSQEKKKKKSYWPKQTDILVDYSIFSNIQSSIKPKFISNTCSNNVKIDRSIGCMLGMGIGDAVGAPLEFQAIDSKNNENRPRFLLKDQKWINPKNKFRLKPGQFTDDSSMGLCIADSLLINKSFNGSDIRIRIWNWWFNGYNNAFHNDRNERGDKQFCDENNLGFLGLTSIGLGTNISKSLKLERNVQPTPIYQPKTDSEDSGNGSLIRLAPIPIFYHKNMENALKYAELSSFTTHPGYHASEACRLLCYILVTAIERDKDDKDTIKEFLEKVTDKYLKEVLEKDIEEITKKLKQEDDDNKNDGDGNKDEVNVLGVSSNKLKRKLNAKLLIKKLIKGNEKVSSKEVCWNWKCTVDEYKESLLLCMNTRKWGYKEENKESDDDYPDLYNNYPVESEYFGAYCNDGLAMALNSCYNSVSFGNAIEFAVNLLGDADSTGSIAGQIAGAFYGYQSIIIDEEQSFLVDQITKWDDYAFGLHGVLLYCVGENSSQK